MNVYSLNIANVFYSIASIFSTSLSSQYLYQGELDMKMKFLI